MLPSFVIIGAMKSGTTSLRWYLDEHPQSGCIRETHFFDQHFHEGRGWYEDHFADQNPALTIGEKTPSYLSGELIAARMKALLPDAKLIAVLRDPVDRAYSHYWHMRRKGLESLPFEDALDAEEARIVGGVPNLGYASEGRYIDQLERFAQFYRREQLHVLLFEDLKSDPQSTFESTCRFLGLDPTARVEVVGRVANQYRRHQPEWLWNFMHKHHLWRRLPAGAAARLARRMTVEAGYPAMSPQVTARLAAQMAPYNERLGRWLDRDLDGWKGDHRPATPTLDSHANALDRASA
jgi:hypothetical protein